MINPQEVRIGNWVDISDSSTMWNSLSGTTTKIVRQQYGQVESIDEDSVLASGLFTNQRSNPITIRAITIESNDMV